MKDTFFLLLVLLFYMPNRSNENTTLYEICF